MDDIETVKRALGVPESTARALTVPSVRTIARQQGIDLPLLLEILSWRRPDESTEEVQFVKKFLDPIEGMQQDDYGNRILVIGENPVVMWSCHTDTVSDEGGMQNVKWDGDTLRLNEPRPGQTLGADDGAGLWLMLEMIKAKRPGLYIFHRAEEVGGLGSKWIARNNDELIANIDYSIAFDRKATHSVITYQRGRRCCSDKFALDLADMLNQTTGLKYELDQGGVFTDTASYMDIIPECTNLSAGYYDEHTSRESLDVAHLLRLREALLVLDVKDLPVERDPSKTEYRSYGGYGSYGGGRYSSYSYSGSGDLELDKIQQLVKDYPYSTSKWLRKMGLTARVFEDLISPPVYRPTVEEIEEIEDEDSVDIEEGLYCHDCCQVVTQEGAGMASFQDGDECPWCYSKNTEVDQVFVNTVTGEVVENA